MSADWTIDAACTQYPADLWFPENASTSEGRSDREAATRVCTDCPVRAQCLTYAVDNRETEGIWGGKTPDQRARLRTRQRAATKARELSDACPNGHLYTEDNTRRSSKGNRICRTCARAAQVQRRANNGRESRAA